MDPQWRRSTWSARLDATATVTWHASRADHAAELLRLFERAELAKY
jgi:hypothetical protein